MSASIVLSCPKCKEQIRAPEAARGKKVRCKKCSEVFPVPGPPAKAPVRTKSPPGRARFEEEEDDDGNPYDVTTLDLTPRCPHCAAELDGDDAIVCINCGYNTVTREKRNTVKTIRYTFLDWLFWLGPPLVCFFALFPIGYGIYWLWQILEADIGEDHRDARLWMRIWGSVIAAAVFWTLFVFAFRRLVLHPKPPMKIKNL